MNYLLSETDAAAAVQSPIIWVLYLVVMFGVFYLLFYRPQKKEQKNRAALVNSVEVNDYILTTSGFYGVVIDIDDDTVVVEFGNNKNCRIAMKKSAIEQVEKPDAQ